MQFSFGKQLIPSAIAGFRRLRHTMIRPSTILFGLLACTIARAGTVTITFETLSELDVVTNQYAPLGVIFSGSPVVLTAGSLLNEVDFPPHSPTNVLFDAGGPITLTFTDPVSSVSAYFTYTTPLTLQTFDPMGTLSQTQTSSGSSNLGSNELIGFTSLQNDIGSLVITGDPSGNSFTMDDVTATITPEPGSLLPLLSAVLVFVMVVFRKRRSVIPGVLGRSASDS